MQGKGLMLTAPGMYTLSPGSSGDIYITLDGNSVAIPFSVATRGQFRLGKTSHWQTAPSFIPAKVSILLGKRPKKYTIGTVQKESDGIMLVLEGKKPPITHVTIAA